ncbi:MAG: glycosyltransferase [Chthoniobacteraceae bacterium]
MKTLCIMDSVSRANGGIFEAERRLQQTLHGCLAVDVQVVGLQDLHTETDRELWHPLNPFVYTVRGPQAFGFAPGFSDALFESDADLAYCVGLWKYPSIGALNWTNQTGKPIIVAPHGMLDPWAVRNSRMKKRLAAWLFENTRLRKAGCLRALCSSEENAIRAYGLGNPVCTVPNGIDLPTIKSKADVGERSELLPPGRKVLLYLGRLHPKKGLSNLLRAWAILHHRKDRAIHDWVLAIAGWDQSGYETELKHLASELKIRWEDKNSTISDSGSVCFLGPQFGKAKATTYFYSDAFILPSYSEGLPMAILEAWSYGKPVLMTQACNLPEGFHTQAALPIDINADQIATGLRQLFDMTRDEREGMGARGRKLVSEQFSWPKVAGQMHEVYQWLLGGGAKPACVKFR